MVNRRGQQYLTDTPVPGPRIIFDAILIILLVAILIKVYFVPTVLEVPARPTTSLQQTPGQQVQGPAQGQSPGVVAPPSSMPTVGASVLPEGSYPQPGQSGAQLPLQGPTQPQAQAPQAVVVPPPPREFDPVAVAPTPLNTTGPAPASGAP